MSAKFDFYTHGLWILGTLFFFLGAIMAGNLRWVEGTTETSFLLAILLSFALFAVGGLMWISAGTNAALERSEEVVIERREEIVEKKDEEELPTRENGSEKKIEKVERDIKEIKEAMEEEEE